MTIKEIISKLNFLEENSKMFQLANSKQVWLNEVNKFESLFCNHPEADNTCYRNNKLVMKSGY
tara:strand:+ start:240 stop:428 length:189 start_codon:yes stop_codon:yes gene_type:complete